MSDTHKKRGRPLKDDAKEYRFTVRMNYDQINKLRDISKKTGLSQSEIMIIGLNKANEIFKNIDISDEQ